MALFGSKKENEIIRKIKPTVIRCENIPKELNKIAKDYGVKVENIDFNLLNVESFIKSKDSDWKKIENEDLKSISKDQLLDENFLLKQVYEIEYFSKSKIKKTLDDLHIAIGANATKCKVYMQIKEGSVLRYYDGLRDDLLDFINKYKIRAGILIYIFDDIVDEVVSKLFAKAKVNESLKFEKLSTYLIAESIEPTDTVDAKILYHYKKDENDEDKAHVDYSDRGFIQSVQKDELLIEILKPKAGEPGRDCSGRYIKPKEPDEELNIDFDVDSDSIDVKEDEFSIKYYSKLNGYITFEENRYMVKSEADIDEISFKTTGSIVVGVDSEVKVKVTEANFEKDAIGSGMDVEVTEVDVEGNVGANTNVKAKLVKVGGQTHKTSNIEADEVDINIHKGKIKAKKVKITRLEHGFVEADEVFITQAIGGEIKAREITIELCGSFLKAKFSGFIQINSMRGSENIFTIDPRIRPVSIDPNENKEKIEELKNKEKALSKEIESYTEVVLKNINAYNDLKKRLINYKKNGLKPPKEFIKQYKSFVSQREKLASLKSDLKETKQKLDIYTHKVGEAQDNILKARVINKDKWLGYNEIKAYLLDPPIELVYKVDENERSKVFGVKKVEDGVYEIAPLSEDNL